MGKSRAEFIVESSPLFPSSRIYPSGLPVYFESHSVGANVRVRVGSWLVKQLLGTVIKVRVKEVQNLARQLDIQASTCELFEIFTGITQNPPG
jgi:hypothetical protein